MRRSPERKALEKLVETNEVFLYQLDKIMPMPSTVEKGRAIAQLVNKLSIATDSVRYSTLGIDYRKDKPLAERVKARLQKRGIQA